MLNLCVQKTPKQGFMKNHFIQEWLFYFFFQPVKLFIDLFLCFYAFFSYFFTQLFFFFCTLWCVYFCVVCSLALVNTRMQLHNLVCVSVGSDSRLWLLSSSSVISEPEGFCAEKLICSIHADSRWPLSCWWARCAFSPQITYTIAKTYQPPKPGSVLSFQNAALGSVGESVMYAPSCIHDYRFASWHWNKTFPVSQSVCSCLVLKNKEGHFNSEGF